MCDGQTKQLVFGEPFDPIFNSRNRCRHLIDSAWWGLGQSRKILRGTRARCAGAGAVLGPAEYSGSPNFAKVGSLYFGP